MAAPLALARLAVTLAQPPRDGADQSLHLLDLAAFEAGERGVAQDFMAQVFAFLAPIEQQGLIDQLPDVFAQCRQCRRQPLGFRRICRCQRVEVVAQALDAQRIENPRREDSALGKIADVGKRCGACRIRQRGRDRIAVP